MKTIKLIIAILIVLLCFTTCSSEEDGETPNENVPSVRTDLIGFEWDFTDEGYTATIKGTIKRDKQGRITQYNEDTGNWVKATYGNNKISGTVNYEYEWPFEITLNSDGYASILKYKNNNVVCSYTKEGYLSEMDYGSGSKYTIQYLSNKIVITDAEGDTYEDRLSNESSNGLAFHLFWELDEWLATLSILSFDGVFGKPYPYFPAGYTNVKRDSKERIISFNGQNNSYLFNAKFYYE